VRIHDAVYVLQYVNSTPIPSPPTARRYIYTGFARRRVFLRCGYPRIEVVVHLAIVTFTN
jgi:hypothetical protein